MKLIAHRGLMDGPDVNLENHPEQLKLARQQGFDCEIDLWVVNAEFYLGHDQPSYPIHADFLNDIGFWIHAKNLGALRWLTNTTHNYFWHQNDDFVITSHKWIWTFPGKDLTQHSVAVLPEWHDPDFNNLPKHCYGICSDYVSTVHKLLN